MPAGTPVRVSRRGSVFRALFLICLHDVYLYDDVLPIANLEPGVSGRNSLPLPGTPGSRVPPGFALLGASWGHLGRSLGRLGRLFGPPGVTLVAFLSSRGCLGLTFSILGLT